MKTQNNCYLDDIFKVVIEFFSFDKIEAARLDLYAYFSAKFKFNNFISF